MNAASHWPASIVSAFCSSDSLESSRCSCHSIIPDRTSTGASCINCFAWVGIRARLADSREMIFVPRAPVVRLACEPGPEIQDSRRLRYCIAISREVRERDDAAEEGIAMRRHERQRRVIRLQGVDPLLAILPQRAEAREDRRRLR